MSINPTEEKPDKREELIPDEMKNPKDFKPQIDYKTAFYFHLIIFITLFVSLIIFGIFHSHHLKQEFFKLSSSEENENIRKEIELKESEILNLKKEIENLKNAKELELSKSLEELVEIEKFELFKEYGETHQLIHSDISRMNEHESKVIVSPADIILSDFNFKGGKNIKIMNGGKSAINTNVSYWHSVIGDKILTKGKINKFKIKITKKTENGFLGGIKIGIAPGSINLEKRDNYELSWSIDALETRFINQGEVVRSLNNNKSLKEGDIIEVTADLIFGKLSFALNGQNLGVVYDSLPVDYDLVPFVELYYKDEREVEIVGYN